jgi:CNT family concentrative nucleoside transporter
LILFHNDKYISQKPFIRVITAVWGTVIERPWNMLSYKLKLIVSWGALAVLYFGSAFGISSTESSPYKWRAVGLCGLALMYGGVYLTSVNRSAVKARTTILGLGFQMILGLFVFKTKAGLDLFKWVSALCADFLESGSKGGGTFFWRSIIDKGDFATNTLSSIIFFVAFATALYYSGVMSWVLKKFGWFFAKSFGLSGAESIVAAASPFIGQGENCILGE